LLVPAAIEAAVVTDATAEAVKEAVPERGVLEASCGERDDLPTARAVACVAVLAVLDLAPTLEDAEFVDLGDRGIAPVSLLRTDFRGRSKGAPTRPPLGLEAVVVVEPAVLAAPVPAAGDERIHGPWPGTSPNCCRGESTLKAPVPPSDS